MDVCRVPSGVVYEQGESKKGRLGSNQMYVSNPSIHFRWSTFAQVDEADPGPAIPVPASLCVSRNTPWTTAR